MVILFFAAYISIAAQLNVIEHREQYKNNVWVQNSLL